MPFPTNERLKNLEELVHEMEEIPFHGHSIEDTTPTGVVKEVVKDGAGTNLYLKVYPYDPSVTQPGNLTYSHVGDNPLKSIQANTRWVKVFPIDVPPELFGLYFPCGKIIDYWQRSGTGDQREKIRGTFVTMARDLTFWGYVEPQCASPVPTVFKYTFTAVSYDGTQPRLKDKWKYYTFGTNQKYTGECLNLNEVKNTVGAHINETGTGVLVDDDGNRADDDTKTKTIQPLGPHIARIVPMLKSCAGGSSSAALNPCDIGNYDFYFYPEPNEFADQTLTGKKCYREWFAVYHCDTHVWEGPTPDRDLCLTGNQPRGWVFLTNPTPTTCKYEFLEDLNHCCKVVGDCCHPPYVPPALPDPTGCCSSHTPSSISSNTTASCHNPVIDIRRVVNDLKVTYCNGHIDLIPICCPGDGGSSHTSSGHSSGTSGHSSGTSGHSSGTSGAGKRCFREWFAVYNCNTHTWYGPSPDRKFCLDTPQDTSWQNIGTSNGQCEWWCLVDLGASCTANADCPNTLGTPPALPDPGTCCSSGISSGTSGGPSGTSSGTSGSSNPCCEEIFIDFGTDQVCLNIDGNKWVRSHNGVFYQIDKDATHWNLNASDDFLIYQAPVSGPCPPEGKAAWTKVGGGRTIADIHCGCASSGISGSSCSGCAAYGIEVFGSEFSNVEKTACMFLDGTCRWTSGLWTLKRTALGDWGLYLDGHSTPIFLAADTPTPPEFHDVGLSPWSGSSIGSGRLKKLTCNCVESSSSHSKCSVNPSCCDPLHIVLNSAFPALNGPHDLNRVTQTISGDTYEGYETPALSDGSYLLCLIVECQWFILWMRGTGGWSDITELFSGPHTADSPCPSENISDWIQQSGPQLVEISCPTTTSSSMSSSTSESSSESSSSESSSDSSSEPSCPSTIYFSSADINAMTMAMEAHAVSNGGTLIAATSEPVWDRSVTGGHLLDYGAPFSSFNVNGYVVEIYVQFRPGPNRYCLKFFWHESGSATPSLYWTSNDVAVAGGDCIAMGPYTLDPTWADPPFSITSPSSITIFATPQP